MIYNTNMTNGYQDPLQAQNYSDFLESDDGKFQKQVILEAVLKRLDGALSSAKILDLGCGPGWLSYELSKKGFAVTGCDAAQAQINLAKKNYPELSFVVADPQVKLPFADGEFNVIVASLIINDLNDQPAALKEIRRVLKPGGKFINIITNPYYAYPVGQWKRGFWGKIFGKKPTLKLLSYFSFVDEQKRNFTWRKNLPSRFYSLPEQLNNITTTGFKIKYFDELKSKTDTKKFSRQHQIYRFPLYLLIEAT